MQPIGLRKLFVLSLVIVLIGLLMPQALQADTPGIDPNSPIWMTLAPKEVGYHQGTLAPGQETWFAIKVSELDGELIQPFSLSLFANPGDGNALHNINLELFNSSFAQYWSAMDVEEDEAMYFGRGAIVERENGEGDPFTGTLGWRGDVVNNEMFLVCVRNDNAFDINYWLFTDDIANAELGSAETPVSIDKPAATEKPIPVEVPAGTDPNFPIWLEMGPKDVNVHSATLMPGEETWLAVKVSELEGEDQLPLQISSYTFPGDGNVINKMRMEVFNSTYAGYWSNDNLDNDEAMYFGRGSVVEHEAGDPFVGTLGWSGDVTNNEPFFVCLRNDNDIAVRYWFFTDYMEDAELGIYAPSAPGVW